MSCSEMALGYNLWSSNDLAVFCHVLFSFNLHHKDCKESSCSKWVLKIPAKCKGLSNCFLLYCVWLKTY